MTQFWSIPDETLQEFIEIHQESEGISFSKKKLYLTVLFFAWAILPMLILAPRGKGD